MLGEQVLRRLAEPLSEIGHVIGGKQAGQIEEPYCEMAGDSTEQSQADAQRWPAAIYRNDPNPRFSTRVNNVLATTAAPLKKRLAAAGKGFQDWKSA